MLCCRLQSDKTTPITFLEWPQGIELLLSVFRMLHLCCSVFLRRHPLCSTHAGHCHEGCFLLAAGHLSARWGLYRLAPAGVTPLQDACLLRTASCIAG